MNRFSALLFAALASPAFGQGYVTPLPPGGLYAPFGTADAFTPIPLDLTAYYRDPARYPAHAYHGPTYRVNVYLHPSWNNVLTKDGVRGTACIKESLSDFYLWCQVGFYEVRDPKDAWYTITPAGPQTVVNLSERYQNGYGSGYWAAAPDGRTLTLGYTIKPAYGGGPAHSRNLKAFLKRGMYWWYGWRDLSRCDAGAAANNCLSSEPKYPWTAAGRAVHGYGGIKGAEGSFLGRTFGPQPWLYRFQKGLNPQRLELYREEEPKDIGGDKPWDETRVAPFRADAEPARPIVPPRETRRDLRSYLICP